MKFTDLDLDPRILKGIEEMGFSELMPVQEHTFPHTFTRKDIYVQSQTGSGKTAAFIISIYHLFLNEPALKDKQALIVAPTRELAVQIGREAEVLGKYLDFTVGVFYGGIGYGQQEKLLREKVNLIIGTPGRLLDFSQSKKLDMKNIGIFVIDEADRLFDMGFIPDIRRMFRMIPPWPERQTMLYSATLDSRVKSISGEYMHEPAEVQIDPEQVTVEQISQELYHVARDEKMQVLIGLLKKNQPKNAIIFTNTKHMAVRVSDILKANGFHSQYIIGDLPQKKRIQIIDSVKKGTLPFLVATDVASRGLHVDDLELVINYDIPEYTESYVHRIGRTARVGKKGTAISLVCEHLVYELDDIESYINMKIPVAPLTDDLFIDVKKPSQKFREIHGDKRKTASMKATSRKKKTQGSVTKSDYKGGRASSKKSGQKKAGGSAGQSRGGSGHGEHKKAGSTGKRKEYQEEKKRKQQPDGKKDTQQQSPRTSKKKNMKKLEDRIDYYSEKYGESFTLTSEKKKDKPNLGRKIAGLFKKKK